MREEVFIRMRADMVYTYIFMTYSLLETVVFDTLDTTVVYNP